MELKVFHICKGNAELQLWYYNEYFTKQGNPWLNSRLLQSPAEQHMHMAVKTVCAWHMAARSLNRLDCVPFCSP